ncbi:MAG: hypothetical protein JWN92_1538 [Candidatus Acidoferrum typicum]|nr:hypothetical protein [Candidatus Acidoferrum typicum]
MFRRILRMRGIIPGILILAAISYWRLHSGPPKALGIGYVSDRDVPMWNTLAQVRQRVGDLHYGERVEIMRQEGTTAQVRTASGALGWLLDSRDLMDPSLWEQSTALLARARAMPVQARGQTKTVSNVRIEPGRNGKRIFQFPRGTQVVVLDRTVADAPQSNEDTSTGDKAAGAEEPKAKQEDWLLVLRGGGSSTTTTAPVPEASPNGAGGRASAGPVSGGPTVAQSESPGAILAAPPIAGWVLSRFIEPDLPGPVRDYASSSDLHVVAWFELNRVPDGSGGQVPQYLVAGSHGGEGQVCDFTMLRVYSWSTTRKRYETAYVESNLCGHLPIQVSSGAAGPEFHFAEGGGNGAERDYVMRQTVVRRVTSKSPGTSPSRR